MPGLLDSDPGVGGGLLGDPSTLFFASLIGPGNNLGRSVGLYQQGLSEQQDRQAKRLLYNAQIKNYESEAAKRQFDTDKGKALQAAVAEAFAGGGVGPDVAGSLPGGVGSGGLPFDPRPLIRAGVDPKDIAAYAELKNIGRQEVARTVEGKDDQGRPATLQYDKYGQAVGSPLLQWKAPVSVNQGNKNTFIDPVTLQPVQSFQTFQSPDSVASNAVAIRGQNMADARSRDANALGRVPAGYRQTASGGLEFIPGGPADPNAAKKAAPTEFQGKSAAFGARAQEADKILGDLQGKYSPAGINSKNAIGNTYLIGGALEAGANMMLSPDSQKAEQAQRDFINAILRQESGAAIGKDEFANAKRQYFPQPGDGPEVIAQKANNRKIAVQGLINNARPGAVEQELGGSGQGGEADRATAELRRRGLIK